MRITDIAVQQRFYQALLERDVSYVGSFFVGVKTTSVFCIATCRARKPKFENIEFFTEVRDVLAAGYRPCKVCRPTEHAHEPPTEVLQALALVRQTPKAKVSDTFLREQGIAPEKIRRWFNANYGMTFQAYQRMLRINTAFEELQHGKTMTDTALDNGYDSLSGFAYTYKKCLGKTPQQHSSTQVIRLSRITTPLGPMFLAATDEGLCLLEFVDRRMLETEFEDLQRRLQAPIIVAENRWITQAKRELAEYFAGQRTDFEVPLDTPGTAFQQRVWQVLQEIPFAELRSYQQQAEALGNPKAVRAVAGANGMNRVAIIIPCHRVIGKNGQLTGYGGGLERKRWLIEHEQRVLQTKQQTHFRLVPENGSDSLPETQK
ncbi:XRE family transcriptional regulator [Pseudidiomarina sediminum]|uniref:Methylated-DNA--protein-cysteine methyltransferase n=1 Tax=Pseudidiomarina sediminum TaxID=431675 RepID=A0A432Z8F5_9GAMM|nr:methylated-DNA--[protein]-cysteine S-methyltransferase [Pseudidiomarina sediminum]RUO74175.1 XRE family transcriptional regulator [Pseudidiomarina sediminum]